MELNIFSWGNDNLISVTSIEFPFGFCDLLELMKFYLVHVNNLIKKHKTLTSKEKGIFWSN